MIDCEHFFDGYKGNRDYALAVAKTAFDAGARWVVLCDTNGGTLPHEVERIVADVAKHVKGTHLGIHTHNDTENAVANTLMAVRAGCRQIQGTLNGLGERCGNANLTSIIPTLLLNSEFADAFTTGVTPERLRSLTHASRVLDEVLNEAPDRHAPYVGESAFATKAGIHASALIKAPETYEHVAPESVGNERRILVSKQGGRSSLTVALERLGLPADKDDPRVEALLEEVKAREDQGYSYEAAEASFELLARRSLASVPRYFSVDNFRVTVERQGDTQRGPNNFSTLSHAVVSCLDRGRGRALGFCRRRQRPGERAGQGVAQRSRPLSETHRERQTRRLQGSHPDANAEWRHRSRNARSRRKSRHQDRRSLDDGRRISEHHRCELRGAARQHQLQAAERERSRRLMHQATFNGVVATVVTP